MAITVHEIELREIRLRLVEPFRISSGETWDRRILLLRLAGGDDAGRTAVAWGECVAGEYPSYGYETIDTARLAIREWLAPRLLGRPFGHPREVFGLLDRNLRGHRMAKAALEMASWELAARLAGEPLAGLLGGERRQVATGVSLGIQDSPEDLAAKGLAALERGYRKVKAKIRPGEDREYLAALRRGLGPDAPLAVDANTAYRVDDFDHLASLDEFGLMMLEQPLEGGDLLRHARLQERIETPICLDETIDTPTRAADMIELGAGRIVNIKPGRVGGFAQAIEIHDLCRAAGVPVWCGGMLESGVGRSHNVALASLPGFTLPGDLSPSDRYWKRDVVDPEWTMDDGMVTVPWERPGGGVEVDEERVASITAWSERLEARSDAERGEEA
jgi:O-succinylbenzoate synthase